MTVSLDKKQLDNIVMIGDRVLIKPKSPLDRTQSGLYLPPSVQEKENVSLGYVIKTGPGFPIPAITDDDEPWKNKGEQVKYVPLQAQSGDLAIFLSKSGYEIKVNDDNYLIVPQSSILMLVRDEGLFR